VFGISQSSFSSSDLTTGAQSATSAASDWRNVSGFEIGRGFHACVDQHPSIAGFGDRHARRLRDLLDYFDRGPGWCEQPNGSRHGQAGEAQFSPQWEVQAPRQDAWDSWTARRRSLPVRWNSSTCPVTPTMPTGICPATGP